jgi:hypothetical protein
MSSNRYYKCIRLLQARTAIPLDDDIFRFKTQAFNHSDCCLVQDVSHQRWLLRATLPTLYFRSCDLGEAVQLVTMKSDIQHENIKQLQRAVRSAFGDRLPQKGALVDVVQVGGRHQQSVLNCNS